MRLLVLLSIFCLVSNAPGEKSSCDRCNEQLVEFKSLWRRTGDEQAVRLALFEVCSVVAPQHASYCQWLVELVPKLTQRVEEIMASGRGCEKLSICGTSAEEMLTSMVAKIEQKLSVLPRVQADPVCNLCEYMVKQIDQLLKNNATLAEIKAGLEKFCDTLSLKEKLTCKAAVPLIMKALEDGLKPKNACVALQLCPNNTLAEELLTSMATFEQKLYVLPHVQVDPVCILCEYMMKEVDQLLKNNATLAEIKAGLEKFCDTLSLKEKLMCKAVLPLIMKELENGLNPKNACVALQLCPNTTVSKLELRGIECGACKDIVDDVDRLLYDNINLIQGIGDVLCHRLPPDTDKACLDFVNNHLEGTLDKLLNTTLSPHTVCTEFIKVCKN